jgi:hypothetical protein
MDEDSEEVVELPILNYNDKRAVSFLNEFRVVEKLARKGNEWMYVGQIADKQTKEEVKKKAKSVSRVTSIHLEGHDHLTKPGAASACKRLAKPDIGILEVKKAKPPKRAGESPHYRIQPSLNGLARIKSSLHSGVLSIVRQSDWGQEIITKDLRKYLAAEFKSIDGSPIGLKAGVLLEIEFMARHSTKALEVLLGPKADIYPVGKETRVKRLRDLMHLAFALDFATMHEKALEEMALSGKITVKSHFKKGGISLDFVSNFKREEGKSDESTLEGKN